MQVHPISLASYCIIALAGDENPSLQSHASGFLWKRNEETFLITNWHVVSGQNYLTKKTLSASGARPNVLLVEGPETYIGNAERNIPNCSLYTQDKNPAWFEHPTLGSSVDIAAVHVRNLDGIKHRPINTLSQCNDMRLHVSADCFVVGYPLKRDSVFPIWKRASIASEPEMTLIPGINRFYIDTATRPGMSGSPVILHAKNGYIATDGTWKSSDHLGVHGCSKLIGIYSSREPPDASGLQLGVVFPTKLIEELIESIPIGSV